MHSTPLFEHLVISFCVKLGLFTNSLYCKSAHTRLLESRYSVKAHRRDARREQPCTRRGLAKQPPLLTGDPCTSISIGNRRDIGSRRVPKTLRIHGRHIRGGVEISPLASKVRRQIVRRIARYASSEGHKCRRSARKNAQEKKCHRHSCGCLKSRS